MYPAADLMKQTDTTTPGHVHLHHDELVWISAAREDLAAFRPLYDKYYEAIYLFIHRRCFEQEDCLDLTSQVFEKAMVNISKYKYQGFGFGTWLYAIARNILADYFKKANRDAKLWVRDEGLMEMADDLDKDPATEENIAAIIDAIKLLPDAERDLVVMKYFEKMSYEELAEMEQTNINHMRVKLHRIINSIRKIVERRMRR
jgi:RNA polymerase sigma-70 factor (ECF subfamily)